MCRCGYEIGRCDCVAIAEFGNDSDTLCALKWQNCQRLGVLGKRLGKDGVTGPLWDMVMVQNLHLLLSTIVGYRDVGSGR